MSAERERESDDQPAAIPAPGGVDPNGVTEDMSVSQRVRRAMWVALGATCVALGIVGIALPLLPTTPFLLLAAYCFARGSARLHDWLMAHPRLGPPIDRWQRYGAISRGAKRAALLAMLAVFVIACLWGLPLYALALQFTVLVCVAVFILTRPDPPETPDA